MNLLSLDITHQTASRGFTLAGGVRAADRTASGPEATSATPESSQATAEPSRSKGVSLSSESMMASHFVHAGRRQSEYVSGMMVGLDLQNQFATQMQSVVAGYRDVANLTAMAKALQGKEIDNADLNLIGTKAAEALEDVIDAEVSEKNAEQAEELRQDVEEKAEEATASEIEKVLENETLPQEALEEDLEDAAPADENGQTAAPTETETVAPTKTETVAAEAAPDRDDPAPAASGTEAAPAVPPTPSIDILV